MSTVILNELLLKLKIPNITRNTKCWVVRCEKGFEYYDNFKKHGIAAIGHIDSLGYKRTDDFLNNIEDATQKLITNIKASNPEYSEDTLKRIATKYINQSLTFINEIKENDYIITIGDEKILVGYAQKYFGMSNENLSIEKNLKGKHYNIDMTLSLRRDVIWSYEIDKNKLPNSLFKSLLSQSTVYNLKDINSLLHLIYPIYVFEKQLLHFSININQKRDLNNFHISKLFMLLNQFEFILHESENINIANFDSLFSTFDNYSLFVKAEFMSPGATWASIVLEHKKISLAIVLYGMLFGNSVLGMEGIIDKELRHKIFENVFTKNIEEIVNKKIIENTSTQKMFKELELNQPEEKIQDTF